MSKKTASTETLPKKDAIELTGREVVVVSHAVRFALAELRNLPGHDTVTLRDVDRKLSTFLGCVIEYDDQIECDVCGAFDGRHQRSCDRASR